MQQFAAVSQHLFLWTHYCRDSEVDISVDGFEGRMLPEGGIDEPLSGLSPHSFLADDRRAGEHADCRWVSGSAHPERRSDAIRWPGDHDRRVRLRACSTSVGKADAEQIGGKYALVPAKRAIPALWRNRRCRMDAQIQLHGHTFVCLYVG